MMAANEENYVRWISDAGYGEISRRSLMGLMSQLSHGLAFWSCGALLSIYEKDLMEANELASRVLHKGWRSGRFLKRAELALVQRLGDATSVVDGIVRSEMAGMRGLLDVFCGAYSGEKPPPASDASEPPVLFDHRGKQLVVSKPERRIRSFGELIIDGLRFQGESIRNLESRVRTVLLTESQILNSQSQQRLAFMNGFLGVIVLVATIIIPAAEHWKYWSGKLDGIKEWFLSAPF
jgi:hypothetical protein